MNESDSTAMSTNPDEAANNHRLLVGPPMRSHRVPWYRWRFSLAGVAFGCFFLSMAWESVVDNQWPSLACGLFFPRCYL